MDHLKEPSYAYPKSLRLLSKKQFSSFRHGSKRFYGNFLIIEVSKKDPKTSFPPKLGIAVSKKYGKAHDRNRFKRQVREAFRHLKDHLPLSIWLVVKPKNDVKEVESHALFNDFLFLSKKITKDFKPYERPES